LGSPTSAASAAVAALARWDWFTTLSGTRFGAAPAATARVPARSALMSGSCSMRCSAAVASTFDAALPLEARRGDAALPLVRSDASMFAVGLLVGRECAKGQPEGNVNKDSKMLRPCRGIKLAAQGSPNRKICQPSQTLRAAAASSAAQPNGRACAQHAAHRAGRRWMLRAAAAGSTLSSHGDRGCRRAAEPHRRGVGA
jgi:hypothetical protein